MSAFWCWMIYLLHSRHHDNTEFHITRNGCAQNYCQVPGSYWCTVQAETKQLTAWFWRAGDYSEYAGKHLCETRKVDGVNCRVARCCFMEIFRWMQHLLVFYFFVSIIDFRSSYRNMPSHVLAADLGRAQKSNKSLAFRTFIGFVTWKSLKH